MNSVHIIEVSPRDGLQNEKNLVSSALKKEFISTLVKSGLSAIELTACVSPKAVPQMADAEDILSWWSDRTPSGVEAFALVPNKKGYERLRPFLDITAAAVMGVSNEFNLKNIRLSNPEALEEMRAIFELADGDGRPFRAYISTSFGCPYEGPIKLTQFMTVFEKLLHMGVRRFSIGDTIGVATPLQTREWAKKLLSTSEAGIEIAFHMHDTFGRGLANCFTAYEEGIRHFDTSAGGLGGCPYAAGASGNVATEDVIDAFTAMGIKVEGNPQGPPDITTISGAVKDLTPTLKHLPLGHLFQRWYKKHHG